MERNYTHTELRLAIADLKPLAGKLFGHGKEYEDLLTEILQEDPEGENWRTMKSFDEQLGLPAGQSKKLLLEIWKDMADLMRDWDVPHYNKTETIYVIHAEGRGTYYQFNCKLSQCPRIGENITFRFLRLVTGTDIFHVFNIEHDIISGIQYIRLSLKYGSFNTFEVYERDKAKYEVEQARKQRLSRL